MDFDLALILDYIIKEALILIPALWIIGYMLKSTPNIADWKIIWILLALGVALSLLLLGISVEGLIQGILVSGVAVMGHQLIKQTKYKKDA